MGYYIWGDLSKYPGDLLRRVHAHSEHECRESLEILEGGTSQRTELSRGMSEWEAAAVTYPNGP